MKSREEQGKRSRGAQPDKVRITDGSNHDFDAMKRNERRLAKDWTFEDRIRFITTVNAMAGHRQRDVHPITGDRFLM